MFTSIAEREVVTPVNTWLTVLNGVEVDNIVGLTVTDLEGGNVATNELASTVQIFGDLEDGTSYVMSIANIIYRRRGRRLQVRASDISARPSVTSYIYA